MKKLFFIANLFLSFCIVFLANAQEFSLLKSADQNIDIKIGENKVIFFQFKTGNDSFKNLDIVYHASEKLNILTSSQISNIDKNQSKNLFVSFNPKSNALFGKDTLIIEIRENKLLLDVIIVQLNILEKKDLKITPLSNPEFLEPNKDFTASFLVMNNGNSEELLELNSLNGGKTSESKIELKPGQSKIVEVKYSIPSAENDMKLITIMLNATFAKTSETVSKSFSLPLLPSSVKKNDPYLRFPIEASTLVNSFSANGISQVGFQFDLRGKGFLDFSKKHDLEFIIHGPSQFNMPRFGTFDQYYAGYSYLKNTLRVGDNNYKVSNLLEFSRFGRGVEFSKTFDQNTIRAFYLKPRFFNDIKSEKAIVFDRKINDDLMLSFNVLNKKHIIKEEIKTTNLISVSGSYKKENLWAESELSLSKTKDFKTKVGLFTNMFYTKDNLSISSNIILTPKDFNGFYNNSILSNNSIHYSISKKIRVGAIHNLSQINPSLDVFYFTVAPYSNSIIGELSYDYSKNHKLRFNLVSRSREDRMPIKTYDFNENLLRHNYSGKFGDLLVQMDGDFGQTQNKLAEDQLKYKALFRERLQTSYKLFKSFEIGGFAEYLNTNRYSEDNKNQSYLYYGSNVAWNYRNILNFSLFYRNNYTPDELFSSQSFFDSQLEFNFKNHSLSLMASQSFFPAPINEKNVFVSLKYTFRLNTPIKKRKDLGEVLGSINGVNKKGVILQLNGEKVVTDENGNFGFKDLMPGKYILEVKKSSLSFGTIIDQKTPIEIEVEANSVKNLNLNSIRTGKVSGQIVANNQDKSKPITLENILIKIYKDDFSLITLTNKFGDFSFNELKEGDYKVKIVSEQIKNLFSLKTNDFTVSVEDGKDASCIFVLEEKKKNIKFQPQVISLSGL